MKQVLKKLWIVLCLCMLINVPILVVGTYRTNKTATLKGDLTDITSFVEIDNDINQKGSFSSIYVISFDKITILQNMLVKANTTSDLDEMNENYTHFSDLETNRMGVVQKNSSIMTAIITAYNKANEANSNIKLDYSFKSLCVSFYFEGMPFKIEDEIIAINNTDIQVGYTDFLKCAINADVCDVVTVMRKNKKVEITLTDRLINMCRWYPYYDINYDTANPTIKVKNTNVGGPSGGLLQTLSIYNRLVDFDYTNGLKITGTGTMSINGTVGAIGGIQQKIYTAFDDNADVFLCPLVHKEEALEAYNQIEYKEKMELVFVETLDDAISYLYAKKV